MTKHDLLIGASTIWVVVTAILVMFMQAGFAFLEAGLTRMKNAGHIAGKNVLIFGVASLVYWLVGFGLAFGDGNGLVGTHGFAPSVDALLAVGKAPYAAFTSIPGAAAHGATKPQAAVTATSAASTPLSIIETSGLRRTSHATQIPPTPPAAAARFVVSAT